DKQDPGYLALIQEKGSVFNDPAWLELFGNRLRLYGIYDHDSLRGAFSLYHTRIYGLSYIKNPITTPHCGLIYCNESGNRYKRNSQEKAIHACIAGFLRTLKAGIIQFNLPPEVKDVQPYLWKGFKVSPTYTYRLDLTTDIEEIVSQFDPKLRSDITKAQKDSVETHKCVSKKDLIIVRDLVRKTLERKAGNNSYDLIDKILYDFSGAGKSFAFITKNGDQPLAAAYCVHDTTTAYYILGGYDADQKQRGAAGFTILSAIQYAKELGIQTFDFEGSMIPAIESFFRGFGGELTVKYAVHRAWLPVEMVLKFFKRSVY
ncbi:MAG: GNAT family N-acetyltransferase, partial [Bacteroidales bacterium]